MENDFSQFFKETSRKHIHEIWEYAKNDDLNSLSDEDKMLAQILLEHAELFHNDFEFADVMYEYEYDPETDVNPFLHIQIHEIVENQLRDKEPIEAFQFYSTMRRKKVSHHDTIHLLGQIIIRFMYVVLKMGIEFDIDFYKVLLKKYKDKKPDKISKALDRDFGDYLGEQT